MRVVGTFHASSSVSRSLKCSLTAHTTLEHLVIAKTDRLEVYSLRPEGLRKECDTNVWGRVVSLQAIPAKESGRSHLLVMTDHPDPKLIVLAYQTGATSLTEQASLSLADPAARPAEFVTDIQVDPTGKIAIVSCYTGKLKVVPIEGGILGTTFDVLLPELNLLSFTFLHTRKSNQYTLALLHFNHRRQIQLLCRDVDLNEFELSPAHSNLIVTTVLSDRTFPTISPPPLLVPVPAHITGNQDVDEDPELAGHRGGVLVLGGRKILFYEHSTKEQQETRKGKQRRLSKKLASEKEEEVTAARKKEEERESRKAKVRASIKWPWGSITAWCVVGQACRRLLLGDEYGRLAMLAFDDTKMCLTLIPLGETSPATSLSYLSSQFLYVSSHYGDSQLLRIHDRQIASPTVDTLPIPKGIATVASSPVLSSEKGKGRASELDSEGGKDGRIVHMKGTWLEIVESHDNIAPISDAVLADMDGSGQPQVVTCSGARNSGSLRVIRTEANFQELSRLDGLSGLTDIWPVKPSCGDPEHSHLVISTLRETLVFALTGQETIEHVDPSFAGFSTDAPTLAVGNIPRRQITRDGGRDVSSYVDSRLVVQVTSQGAFLVEYDPTLRTFSRTERGWFPKEVGAPFVGREVVAAAVNPSQFLLGLSGGFLVLLNLKNDALQKHLHTSYAPNEICAISCSPLDPTKSFARSAVVSFWGSNKVIIVNLANGLEQLLEVTLPALPRAVLLHNFGSSGRSDDPEFRPHLLVGLADGTLVTYTYKDKENVLQDRKQSALGNAPVSLSVCRSEGRLVVIASGTRANLLFWDKQRIKPSPVSIKDMVRGTTLNAAAFPSCLAIATSSSLLFGTVRGLDKMQIRTVPLGLDNPRKIAYHPGQQVFGVGCIRTTPSRIGELEETTGSFKLLDAHSFQQLHEHLCDASEQPSTVLAFPGDGVDNTPALCLGTVVIRPEDREPSRGRIVLFSVSPTDPAQGSARSLHVLASEDVKGCVYAIVRISDDLLAAAINTAVILYRIHHEPEGDYSLGKAAEWNHNHFITNLVYDGQHLLVGDAISSVSVLRWRPENGRLETVARDYGPLWPVSIEATGNGGIIGANSDCNLFSFTLQQGPLRTALEKEGIYNIDDVVNKFMRGTLSSADATENKSVRGTHVFFTATGRIGAIMEINDNELSVPLTVLQQNMAKTLVGPGGMNHTKLRAPANPRGRTDAESSVGFLDGDFLEQFLAHPEPEEFMEGEIDAERVTLGVNKVREILAEIQGLH